MLKRFIDSSYSEKVVNSGIILRLLVLLSMISGWVALAHDPHEISSRAYLRSNRLDLEIDMEFSVAVLVAGVDRTEAAGQLEGDLFQRMVPRLREEAAGFFQVFAGEDELPVLQTEVSLGNENHVRLSVAFPLPDSQPLGFNARGLQRLGVEGPYGTTLTVLDMVNQKVLGQPVLFAHDSTIDIPVPSLSGPTPQKLAAPRIAGADGLPESTSRQGAAAAQAEVSGGNDPEPPASRWWIWVILLVTATDVALLIYWFSNGRKRRSNS